MAQPRHISNMRILKQLFILIIVLLGTFPAFAQDSLKLSIQDYPNLPAEPDQPKAFGFAGMLGGVHNGVMIAGGGANFPDALPWEGGQKNGAVPYISSKMTYGNWQKLLCLTP